jgi:UrcA family protein
MYSNEMSVTKTLRIAWGIVASAAIAWGSGNAAQAAEPDNNTVPHKVVSFKDLNIQTPEGAKILYHRIRLAAADVCGDSDAIMRDAVHKCVETAIDNAVRKVNAPYLTALRFGGDVNVRVASK